MEYKPTITYSFSESSDESLFLTLSTHMRKILLNHPVKWQRSYGRTQHELSLDVKFLPLTSALLKRSDLVTRPYFHVFWTDCNDIDFYRSSVKSEIASWLSELIGNEIFDWMIVVVTGDGTSRSSKPKLTLPRSSLADKIKADFCSKCPERMYVLQDPMKDSSKTTESWSSLATKLASFTIVCLEQAVTKYEERVRAERERRNEKSWNFCSYFIMQEELAFMFEMLRLHAEALIQYNELDAMFTQYLLNAQAGDVAHWLSSFTSASITQWRSLSLWRRIDGDARQMLVEETATLIDVRNYLFARHCHLLFAIGNMKKVTELMHTFLHATVLELDILEIELPQGAKECWMFMSCMELTQTLERNQKHLKNNQSDEADLEMSHDDLQLETANLWNLARQKLHKLGELCGLMPEVETKSEDLQTVVNLISGMGEEEERDGKTKSPSLILREALSSKENFRNQYMELSELAMGIYKHMGRYRSARSIGKDLAEFYMRSNEPEKAESFLVDCVRSLSNESWPLLTSNVSERLAECYKRQCNVRRYIRLCCALMCDNYVTPQRREFYSDELCSNSTDFGDHNLPILLAVFANVTAVQFVPAQTSFRYKSKQHLHLHLHIHSAAPKSIRFKTLQISLRHQDINATDGSNKSHSEVTENDFEIDAFSYATFSSDEECEVDSISLGRDTTADTLSSLSKKSAIQRNHIHRKRRFVSTSSYDSIFAIQQKTKMESDGTIQLVTMEESFSQPSKCMANVLPSRINVSFESETKSEEVSWAGITCRTAHKLLRRQDSYQSLRSLHATATNIVMETYEDLLEAQDVTIRPGDNVIDVEIDTSKPGDFTLRQLRFTMNKLHFVLPRILPIISYTVTRKEPILHVRQEPRIFCSTKRCLTIILTTGDYGIENEEEDRTIIITLSKRLRILSIKSVTVETEDGIKSDHPSPDVSVNGVRCSFLLPSMTVHSTVVVVLCCICEIPDTSHDIDCKSHRRSHSAPPSTQRKRSQALTDDHIENNLMKDSPEKPRVYEDLNSSLDGSSLKLPPSPSLKPAGRGNESPVKKFLSFVREVADRVDNKRDKKEDLLLSTPTVLIKDDFLEVTLEEPAFETEVKSGTFPIFHKNNQKYLKKSPNLSIRSDENHVMHDVNESSDESPLHLTSSINSINSSIKKSSSLSDKHGTPRSEGDLLRRHGNTLPVHEESDEEHTKVNCNISICLPWSNISTFTTSVTFIRPLEFNHRHNRFHSTRAEENSNIIHHIVTVSVENQSTHSFHLRNFCLRANNSGQISVTSLTDKDERIIAAGQSITFSWSVVFNLTKPPRIGAQFNVDVASYEKDKDDYIVSPATYRFEIENIQTIYIVSTKLGEDNAQLISGQMTSLEIVVKRNRSDPEHEHTRSGQQLLMFQVVDTRGRWAVCGKSTGIVSLPLLPSLDHDSESDDCMATATLEVMPLIHGLLHRPSVVLQRYLKRNSSEFDEQLSSTDSPVMKPPRLLDFKPGEVLYIDEYKQVNVTNVGDESENNINGVKQENVKVEVQKTKF